MQERSKIHVDLDVYKNNISIAAAEPGRLICKVTHDVSKLLKVLTNLGNADQLHIAYEADPTGFGLQRALHSKDYPCEIITPSQIPRRLGERIKTDGRDCVQLAECSRAGQWSAVWIPDPEDEAIHDLSRAREDAVNTRVQARYQLKGFLLRHDVRYTGQISWFGAYYHWLGTLNFGVGPAQTAFTKYWQAVTAPDDRVDRPTKALQASITGWRFEPVVAALQALRGVAAITAIGLVAEIGDLGRFAHPRKLMGYLGLAPCEHSSGQRTNLGSITKTGNAHARRLLTNKACTAVARELAGFMWAIGMQAQREQGKTICKERGTPNKQQDRSGNAIQATIGHPSRLLQGHRKADIPNQHPSRPELGGRHRWPSPCAGSPGTAQHRRTRQ